MAGTYDSRRGELETYFDRTASDTWQRLTSDAPVSRVRQTVREGRNRMRATLLSWLPDDMTGLRLLDAGCGTGALSVEAAKRGADVVAVDIAGSLVGIAAERTPRDFAGSIDFRVGDMLSPDHGEFDYVVSMDSLIHYKGDDIAASIATLGERTRKAILFTYAPATPASMMLYTSGKLFPRSDRSPRIVPISKANISRRLEQEPKLSDWTLGRTLKVKGGFYQSSALEVKRG